MFNTPIKRLLAPAAVCLLLGMTLALQVKTQVKVQETIRETRVTEERVAQLLQVTQERDRIREELAELRATASRQETQAQLEQELEVELVAAGLLPVKGSGVVISMEDRDESPDSTRKIWVKDVLQVLNELRAADVEAVAVNGVRVTPRTAFARPFGQALTVNGLPVTGPVRIEAVGNPALILVSLNMRGGVVHQLEPFIHITLAEAKELEIRPLSALPENAYARPKR